MPNKHYVFIMGHLGQDPDIRDVGSGGANVATLSVATTESYKNRNGEWKDAHTEWHRCNAWNKHADEAARLHKGDAVLIIGKNRTRKYTGKDGIERYTTEIHVDVLQKIDYERKTGNYPPPIETDPQYAQDEYDIGDLGPPIDMDNNPLSPGD